MTDKIQWKTWDEFSRSERDKTDSELIEELVLKFNELLEQL
jgi:hypothetical protein